MEKIKLLTTKQVAEMLGCSTHHVSDLRKYGFIRGTRFSRNWLYTEDDINEFIRNSIGKDFWNFRDMTKEAIAKGRFAADRL